MYYEATNKGWSGKLIIYINQFLKLARGSGLEKTVLSIESYNIDVLAL